MMKLIKYELNRNKLYLLLVTVITLVFGALPLPFALKGDAQLGFNIIVPTLMIILLIYGIGVGMLVFMVLQQREVWNRNGILLFSLPVSRFKIFSSKILTGLIATVGLFAIIAGYSLLYINILDGTEVLKEIASYIPSGFTIVVILSAIGEWLYWIMTIIFLIVLSKTILGHNKNKGWIVALTGIGLIIVLPIGISILSLFVMGFDTVVNTHQVVGSVEAIIPEGTNTSVWISLIFNWVMSSGMFIASGMFLDKKLNI